MAPQFWVEVGLVLIGAGGVVGIFLHRFRFEKGIGVRAIQMTAVVLLVPLIGLLALENAITSEVGALLGTVIGYVLSGIGKDETNPSNNN